MTKLVAIFASSDVYVLCHVCLFKSSINASTNSLLGFLITLLFKEFSLLELATHVTDNEFICEGFTISHSLVWRVRVSTLLGYSYNQTLTVNLT